MPDSECFAIASTKPFETKKCKLADCPLYRWRVTPWSKVSMNAGLGFMDPFMQSQHLFSAQTRVRRLPNTVAPIA